MPDINNFPNELIAEIFSYLDLETLTRCMVVNKSFKAFTEHSAFDKIFFRTKALKPEESINLDNIQINPIFNKISHACLSEMSDVYFLFRDKKPDGETDSRKLALIDSSAVKQNATEPAVTHLRLQPCGHANVNVEVEVKSEHAVTVGDVMLGLCQFYGERYGYGSCHYFFDGFEKSKRSTKDELVLQAYWGSKTYLGS